jgi:hypothetical protein
MAMDSLTLVLVSLLFNAVDALTLGNFHSLQTQVNQSILTPISQAPDLTPLFLESHMAATALEEEVKGRRKTTSLLSALSALP